MAAGLEDTGDFTLSIVPSGVTLPPTTDGCFQSLGALTAAATRNGAWNGDCASTHRSGRYARFYSFTLSQQTEVEINLTSAQDTYLYLLQGADANGAVATDNDDVVSGNTNSRITRPWRPGPTPSRPPPTVRGSLGTSPSASFPQAPPHRHQARIAASSPWER